MANDMDGWWELSEAERAFLTRPGRDPVQDERDREAAARATAATRARAAMRDECAALLNERANELAMLAAGERDDVARGAKHALAVELRTMRDRIRGLR